MKERIYKGTVFNVKLEWMQMYATKTYLITFKSGAKAKCTLPWNVEFNPFLEKIYFSGEMDGKMFKITQLHDQFDYEAAKRPEEEQEQLLMSDKMFAFQNKNELPQGQGFTSEEQEMLMSEAHYNEVMSYMHEC